MLKWTTNHWLVLLILILGFNQLCLVAEYELGAPFIENFTPKDYDSNPDNWALIQDQRGIMYIGNGSGLLEFDGNVFRFIKTANSSCARSFSIDKQGTVFVGGTDEFGYLAIDETGDLFYKSLIYLIPEEGRKFGRVLWQVSTSYGVYFIGDGGGKLFRYHQGKITSLNFPDPSRLFMFYDRVFLFDQKSGFVMVFKDDYCQLPYTDNLSSSATQRVFLLPYKDHQLLIVRDRIGMFTYDLKRIFKADLDPKTLKPESCTADMMNPFKTEIDSFLSGTNIYKCQMNKENQYAFGTIFRGIILMDQEGRLIRVVNQNRGLYRNMVWAIYWDKWNNLWAGLNQGISHIELNSPISLFSLQEGAASLTRYQGRLIAGANDGFFILPTYKLGEQDDKNAFISIGEFQPECNDLLIVRGYLFAATFNGVHQIHNTKCKLIHSTLKKNVSDLGWSKKFPNHLFLSQYRGITALEIDFPAQEEIQSDFLTVKSVVSDEFDQINDQLGRMQVDQKGDLWFSAAHNGIIYLRFTGKNISEFKIYRYTTDHGLPELNYNYVCMVDNQIMAATSKGLYKAVPGENFQAQPESLRFVLETTFAKIFSDSSIRVSEIYRESRQKIWVRSGIGLGTLETKQDGEYQWNAIPFKKIRDDQIKEFMIESPDIAWICSNQGIYRFDCSKKKNYQAEFFTLIRRVLVNQENALFNGCFFDPLSSEENHYFRYSLTQPKQMIPSLSYSQNSLTFEYAAPYYEHRDKNRYTYMLDGYDKKWARWTSETKAVYTNLPAGSFLFKVQGKNIFEKESPISIYAFSISPPWHQTIFAYFGYIIIFISFIYGGVRLNTWRLLEAKKKLEKIIGERTVEVVKQKENLLVANDNLNKANVQLIEAKNALWGEMELAKKIQTVLLPKEPKISGYDIAVYNKPADEVGGDYYDVIHVKDKDWIVIGDVSGHGVPAGLIMMMVQTAIHAVLKECLGRKQPSEILTIVNQVIHENIKKLSEDKYMTITIFSYMDAGEFHFSGLHQDIMIFRAMEKEVELTETKGIWLGVMDEIGDKLPVNRINLNPGDVMFLYTDGIPESIDKIGNMYSDEKLRTIFKDLGHLPTEAIKAGILKSLDGYVCNDDITFMILRRN